MNIGIIGSGGREHTLCKNNINLLSKKDFLLPGNAGTSCLAKNIDIDILDFKKY